MKIFFDNPDRLHTLQTSARGWLGTPFVPHACLPGAGVDCVNLVCAIYQACGLWSAMPQMPAYTMDGGKHLAQSVLLAALDANAHFERLPLSPFHPFTLSLIHPGDLLCFTTARVAHHTGVMLDLPLFIHSLFSRVVTMGNLLDRTFARRLTAVYRPVESAIRNPQSAIR